MAINTASAVGSDLIKTARGYIKWFWVHVESQEQCWWNVSESLFVPKGWIFTTTTGFHQPTWKCKAVFSSAWRESPSSQSVETLFTVNFTKQSCCVSIVRVSPSVFVTALTRLKLFVPPQSGTFTLSYVHLTNLTCLPIQPPIANLRLPIQLACSKSSVSCLKLQ